jgi:hypothetical protein
LGPAGAEAFTKMSSLVSQASTKIFNLEGGVKKLSNTFFNTLRYQAANAAIQGVMTSIRNTIDYAR